MVDCPVVGLGDKVRVSRLIRQTEMFSDADVSSEMTSSVTVVVERNEIVVDVEIANFLDLMSGEGYDQMEISIVVAGCIKVQDGARGPYLPVDTTAWDNGLAESLDATGGGGGKRYLGLLLRKGGDGESGDSEHGADVSGSECSGGGQCTGNSRSAAGEGTGGSGNGSSNSGH